MNQFPKLSRAKGFTLIELMVAVGIVGILMSIGIPAYNRMTLKSKQSEAKGALAALYANQRQFYSQYQSYHMDMLAIGYNGRDLNLYGVWNCVSDVWGGTVHGYKGRMTTPAVTSVTGPLWGLGPFYPSWTFAAGYTCNAGPPVAWGICSAMGNNPQTLGLAAIGQLRPGAIMDVWVMNERKTLSNCSNGL